MGDTHTAVCYSVLHASVLHCIALYYMALYYMALYYIALFCTRQHWSTHSAIDAHRAAAVPRQWRWTQRWTRGEQCGSRRIETLSLSLTLSTGPTQRWCSA